MTATREEIARDIVIAALEAKTITPAGIGGSAEAATRLAEIYRTVLTGVEAAINEVGDIARGRTR